MSYDVWMAIDTGGAEMAEVCESVNMTSNVSCMWTKAMGGTRLRDLEGKTGQECIPFLRKGIAAMEDDFKAYKAMNPANGWGDAEGALEFLRLVLRMCVRHPKAHLAMWA